MFEKWKHEESLAHISGWDFSHINGRYTEQDDLPWDYAAEVKNRLRPDARLLDYDTGGGEFLLSLGHPFEMTAATEGYPPNVALCGRKLPPLGIDFRACGDAANIPFEDGSFDIMINRHGSFCPGEVCRLLKDGGVFITQQVGARNDRDLAEFVLPGTPVPFPENTADIQKCEFEKAGLRVMHCEEAFRPIKFFDVGAFVWFARIIEWEFPGFSVDRCLDRLMEMQKIIDRDGEFVGTTHRFLLIAEKGKS